MFEAVLLVVVFNGPPANAPWPIVFVPLAMMAFGYALFRVFLFDLLDEV